LQVWTYGGQKGWHAPLEQVRESKAPGTALGNQLEHFVQVIRKEAKPLITAADAARTLALVEAAGTAAAERRLVTLS
jgi:predicted dehydrogenase